MTMKSEASEISGSKEASRKGADLSQARLALLEKWLKGEKMTGLTAIPRRQGQDRVPLSFAQQRLWFIDKLVPGTPAYNVPCAVELIGPLDKSVFEKCLNEIVRRHEALRTTFPAEDGEPYQIVAPSLTVPLQVIELNDYPEEERESRALDMIHREEQKPFDLVNGPLLRTTLIRLREEHHIFQLTLHHIICDGWSTTILVREVTDLYEAFSAGRPSPLPELAIQYPDFAYWQRDWLKGERLQAQLAYWKEQLADPPILELPADRPRPAIQNLEGARHYFDIPPATAQAIKALGNREGATTFMILLAALATLFYRYTGQEDIVMGIPIANRNRPEIEGLIGFFANTLVLRTSLAGDPTFRELLNRVNRTTVGAYDNQDLPFEWLVGELQPERDMSRNPLFQIMFTHQNWKPPPSKESSRLRYKVLETRKSVSLFDLWWGVWNVGADLQSALEYSTDLYDTATIIRIQNHFLTLLQEVVADPGKPISAVEILTPRERHQLLVEWNDTAVDYPVHTLLHEECREQVRQAPDSVAVVFEDQQLSYGELNIRANQLAHYLKRRSVEPGDVVAICMERSAELMTGLLAILKVGAAYLPLDPRDPAERILNILNDSRSRLLLTREHLIKEIPFAPLKNLAGLSREIVVTPSRPQILDLDSLPPPDRTLVDYSRYNRYFAQGLVKEVINLVATRGCPFNCFYCHKIWPKRHVARSAGNIFEEIKCHYDKGYRTFSIVDDIFNLDRRNSEAFFQQVIKNNLKIRILFPSGLRGDILSPDYIDLMSEAGTMMAALALETASPRVQKLIKKNLNIDKLRENLEYICLKHPHIVLELFTMFGFPTETEEEVLMTFDFIKSIRWLHFPYLNALKIFPNTEMARLALEHGVSQEAIVQFSNLSYNQLGDTLPFSKSFARQYQANFMKEYFLNPERLRSVIFYQKQVLSPEEIVAKYENYLPGGLKSYPEIMEMIENIGTFSRPAAPPVSLEAAPAVSASGSGEGLRILLLDLSLLFSREAEGDVYNPYNPIDVPIGLMYLMTHLKNQFHDRIQGRVMKSMVDFDSYDDLKRSIRDFQPRIIGFRGLSLYKNFFHKTVTLVRQWHPEAVFIAGGPYTTSEYNTLLADRNIDMAVLGEGEITFADLIGKVLENNGELPEEGVLKEIPGLAFLPRQLTVPAGQTVPGRDILMVNRIAEEISRENRVDPPRSIKETDPAYVIYTSGSTGEPKGVVNTHRGIVNRLFWMQDAYRINREDRVMQKTPYTFDVSVWEFFWPLMTGSRLVLARPEGHKDPAYMIRLINRQRITTIHFVPSMLRLFLEEEGVETCTGLKRVICSGEELPLALKERFLSSLNAELHNLYGPTEAAVDVTSWACRSDYERQVVPIGRPIANMQIYLLDRYLNPVPIGVPGELHIGGVGLATGYIGRPHLTEEKFIPHPFSDEPGARLYKTGDLARYLPDGNIEFLGRIDFQVKIRGVRIELGEIEEVLRRHPVLRDAAVLSRQSDQTPGHKQLVAYIIPDQEERGLTGEESGEELSAEQIHDWQKVFDRTYGESAVVDDPAFNILGWNNSYTGLPFPPEEMAEWVETTVERIRSLKPGRVLEIGCGTGLLLFRLAPGCREYYATDFSAAALEYVQRQLDKPGQALPQVKLFQKMAGEFADLPRNHFDTVILNSVVQYFPGIDFLLDVLRECVELVEPRGAIFLGDIRSLPLLEVFYTSVELERAPLALSTAELKQRVKRRTAQEKELVVHPAFFTALQKELPRIGHVEIQLKRGRFHNEMTSFRYDVTLHIGLETETIDGITWLDWQEKDLNMNALEQWLRQNGPGLLGITGVPNARVLPAQRTMDLLAGLERPVSVEQLQKTVQDTEPPPAVDPEAWWELCRQLPYRVEVYGCDGEMNSRYSVLLRRVDESPAAPLKVPSPDSRLPGDGRPWTAYANNPLHEKITLKLIPELRRYLKEKMSEYLIPSAFVLMDAWPLTPSGKLDRQALPAPFQRTPEQEEDYVAPRNVVEERLANIWAQVLGLDQVGIHSNFFELGGDSIHSIWVVARANKAGIQITPQQIFQNQTIADLAGVAVTADGPPAPGQEPDADTVVDVQPFELAGLDQEQLDQLLAGFPDDAVADIYPLAPYQQHILHSMLAGSEATFVFQRLNRMNIPDFDIPRLETALQRMVALRPALRSSFAWEGLEEPVQIVHKQGAVPVTVEDWREFPEEDQVRRLEAGAEAERVRGFSLQEPSAIRLLIARAGDEDYYIIMTGSYIRGDGWSLEIAFADAIRHYGALSAGREVEHQPLPPFSRYIAWLRRQNMDDVETFWRHNLEGFTQPTPLVKKAPGNTPGRQKGLQRQHLYLSADATASVQAMAQKYHLTLNTVLQGAWAVLLSRYTGSDDVVFGVTLSGRTINLPGVETIPGPLFNTLPLRIAVPAGITLIPWLEGIMAHQAEMNQYGYSHLDRIHDWCGLPSGVHLFESFIVFQNLRGTLNSGQNSRQVHQLYTQMDFPLRIDIFPQTEMGLVMTYHGRSFTDRSIARILEDYRALLKSMAADPGQSPSQPLLP